MSRNTNSLFHIVDQEKAPQVLKLIVEISAGSSNKYEFNKDLGCLELDRVLYGPLYYPVNYCDVPQTWNEGDNDPLDAMVFSSSPLLAGSIVDGRVIGMLEMIDNGEIDHKIICVADKDPRFNHVNSIADLREYELKDIRTFFELYKIPQTGKDSVKLGKVLEANEAYTFINQSRLSYQEKFNNK